MDLKQINNLLGKLRDRDSGLQVFGASRHRYQTKPATPEMMVNLSRRLRTWIPREYFQFMIEIGYGAGPYYGLLTPEEVLSYSRDKFRRPMPNADRLFPFRRNAFIENHGNFSSNETLKLVANFPCDGAIVICHHGCTGFSVLVTSGEFAGTVWNAGYSDPQFCVYAPARTKANQLNNASPGGPLSFSEWYKDWLDQQLDTRTKKSLLKRIFG
jgi:hypothetical protein